MATIEIHEPEYDLKEAVSENRLVGLWRMLNGYRGLFVAATVAIGLAAVFQVCTFYLIRYFTDEVLGSEEDLLRQLVLVAAGIVGLALLQGLFTFPERPLGGAGGGRGDGAPARLPLRPYPAPFLRLPQPHADGRADPARDVGRGRACAVSTASRRSAWGASCCSSWSTLRRCCS